MMFGIENRRPLVSVIIPTYNRVGPLQEALASVCAQEDKGKLFDLEIIVVHDASSDATPHAMRRYPDIRYIRLEKNRGLSGARNVGIKASRKVHSVSR